MASVDEAEILADFAAKTPGTPPVTFVAQVTVTIALGETAWNPDGADFVGPATVSYLRWDDGSITGERDRP